MLNFLLENKKPSFKSGMLKVFLRSIQKRAEIHRLFLPCTSCKFRSAPQSVKSSGLYGWFTCAGLAPKQILVLDAFARADMFGLFHLRLLLKIPLVCVEVALPSVNLRLKRITRVYNSLCVPLTNCSLVKRFVSPRTVCIRHALFLYWVSRKVI